MSNASVLSNLHVIRELIAQSALSLGKAIEHYWPVVNPERNGLQESNLTIQFAVQAARLGLHVYPEASNENRAAGDSRVDLLVRGHLKGEPITVLMEAKKLFSAQKAAEMCDDYAKIKGFESVGLVSAADPETRTGVYGVLLAITSQEPNATWWQDPYPWDGKAWDRLAGILNAADSKGVYEVPGFYHQYVLYAIFDLNP